MPTLTYDLLLDKADTAAPVVVAWGSPGAALEPYGNGVVGRTFSSASAPPPVAPASSTPAASAQSARASSAAAPSSAAPSKDR